jgi:predicted permease
MAGSEAGPLGKVGLTALYFVLGVALRQVSAADRRDGEALLRLAVCCTLPALLLKVAVAARSFIAEGSFLPIWLGCAFFNALVAASTQLLFRRTVARRADRAVLCGLPLGANLGLFAYPLIEAVFGAQGLATAALFDLPNSLAVFGFAQAVFTAGRSSPASHGGRREHADGGVYDGHWQSGSKHGHGVYIYPSSARYEGQWLHDSRHGYGVYVFPSGGSYAGSFHTGVPHGYGAHTSPEGRIKYGKFESGQLSETLDRESIDESVRNAASAATTARRVASNARESAQPLVRAVVRKLLSFPPLLAVLGGNVLGIAGVQQLPYVVDSAITPLAQANRVVVMVALGLLLDMQPRAQHVRLAGDALALKYTLSLISALLIALVLPSSLGELKPILASLVCMPVPSVYVQYAIDNSLNSSAVSLAVHTSNVISFVLLLVMSQACGMLSVGKLQHAAQQVPTTVPEDPWLSLAGASVASLAVLLSVAYGIAQRIRLVQLRYEGGTPPPPSQRRRAPLPRSSGSGPSASANGQQEQRRRRRWSLIKQGFESQRSAAAPLHWTMRARGKHRRQGVEGMRSALLKTA